MAYEDVAKGAATGGAIGSFIPGIGTAIGTGLGGLAGGALGGIFGRNTNQETPIQKKQRQLVDQLLGSLNGNGPYAGLFTANPEDFERSFAEPARARFRNQMAPQIQQSYIAGGQQRSTGLEDTLARAGVDIEDLINQNYLQYQQGAQNRQASAIGQILGQGSGAPNVPSWQQAATQGAGGFLASPGLKTSLEDILNSFSNRGKDVGRPPSKGFEQEY